MCGWQNGDGSVENVEAVETLKMWKCGNVEKRSERSRTSEASCIDGCWRADIDKSHMNGRFGFESVSYAFHCWCFFSAYFFVMFDWVLGVGKSPDTRKKKHSLFKATKCVRESTPSKMNDHYARLCREIFQQNGEITKNYSILVKYT